LSSAPSNRAARECDHNLLDPPTRAGDTDEMTSTTFGATKTATVHGTTLAYREEGKGEPVVFVHGGLSDLRTWEQQLPAVGRSYRAITYSRRFARPNEDIDPEAHDPWDAHIEDLAAFLRELGAAPAHLVGNSQGAFISLLTAIRHPEVVRTLVLEEPPAIPLFLESVPPRPLDLLRLLVTRPRAAIGLLRFVVGTLVPIQRAFARGDDERAMRIFGHGVLGAAAYERLPEARIQQMRENRSTLRAFVMSDADLPPLADDDVRGVRAPVLLVTGEFSPPFAIHLTDRLEELLPNTERVEIPAASHVMHEENAPAVNDAIVGFLGRHRPS
jgi:pimeloyl-ACP methyl ester carboxylesterase